MRRCWFLEGNVERTCDRLVRTSKLASLVYKVLNTGHHSPYLTDLLQYHKSARSTCSCANHLLSVARHNLSFSAHAFRVSAPKIWNSLPLPISNILFFRTSS